jgi:AraC family transcriptional regulator
MREDAGVILTVPAARRAVLNETKVATLGHAGRYIYGMSGSASLKHGQFYGTVSRRRDEGAFALSEVVHGSARAFPKHAHARTYVSLLLAGSYGEQVGRRSVDHSPMSVSVRPAGTEHRDRVGSYGGRFFMVELSAPWLNAALEPRDALDAPVLVRGPDALFTLLRLFREFSDWDACSAPAAEQLVAVLVKSTTSRPSVGRPAWLARVHTMVNDRFREQLSLGELAREAGVHPAYVAHAFRAHYGQTPADLARRLRVQSVCTGLANSRRSLTELAYENGFADQAHMTRMLGRFVGATPGELRGSLVRAV